MLTDEVVVNSPNAAPATILEPRLGWTGPRGPRYWVAGLNPSEATAARRRFAVTPATPRLEQIGRIFIRGYNTALTDAAPDTIQTGAGRHGSDGGFFVEGAAMGAAVHDALGLRGRAHRRLVAHFAATEPFLIAVGTGWACARLFWRRRALLSALPPLLTPLAADGWGFHDVYFSASRLTAGPPDAVRRQLGQIGAAAWDNGAGRALWFRAGADAGSLSSALHAAAPARRADLAAGIGLAAAYAGGDPDAPGALIRLLPELAPVLAQGAAFGLAARALANLRTDASDEAARILCRTPPEALAARVMAACGSGGLAGHDTTMAAGANRYARWRQTLIEQFQANGVSNPCLSEISPEG